MFASLAPRILAAGLMLCALPCCRSTPDRQGRTQWVLQPSEAYDALCMVNLLGGDSFYTEYYPQDFERYHSRLTQDEQQAVTAVHRRIHDEGGSLVGPKLALVFSVMDPRTLEDLLNVTQADPQWRTMKTRYLATSYAEGDDFSSLDGARANLLVVLRALARLEFPADWNARVRPGVERFVEEHGADLRRYDVVAANEEVLGRRLNVDAITIYLLGYVNPHGVRITGWRFLSDVTVPLNLTVKTALHELLHPPFERRGAIDALLAEFEKDPFFERLVAQHDSHFGYTTAAGLMEEDLATAVDVYNAHRLGLLPDVRQYYADHDDGIHVFSFLLAHALQRHHGTGGKRYEDFVLGLRDTGELTPGGLEKAFAADAEHYEVKAFSAPAAAGP